MFCQFAKLSGATAFIIACKIMLPLCASAAEDDIFSGYQSTVDRGTIDLNNLNCASQQCLPPASPNMRNHDPYGQGQLFRTETSIRNTANGSSPATIMPTSSANALYSNQNDRAMLLVHQTGTGNSITSVQDSLAIGVSAALTQSGQGNYMIGLQQGNYNIVSVAQSGNSNIASYIQAGNGNTLALRQR